MNLQSALPYICLVGGVILNLFGVCIRKKLKDSKSWPKTSGVIVESTVQSDWKRCGGSYQYIVSPKVTYEYQVQGKKYTSSQLALFEINTANEGLARGKADKYRQGQQVDVYYKPSEPGFATLTVGDPTGGKLPNSLAIFGIGLFIAGIIWICCQRH